MTQSKTSHTPGPWQHTDGHRAVLSADDHIICNIEGIWNEDDYNQVQTEANARLITKAPYMRDRLHDVANIRATKHSAGYVLLNAEAFAGLQAVIRALLAELDA